MKTELLPMLFLAAFVFGCESGQQVGQSSGCFQGDPYPAGPDALCLDANLPTVVRWFQCRSDAEQFAADTHEIIRIEDTSTIIGMPAGWQVYYCADEN